MGVSLWEYYTADVAQRACVFPDGSHMGAWVPPPEDLEEVYFTRHGKVTDTAEAQGGGRSKTIEGIPSKGLGEGPSQPRLVNMGKGWEMVDDETLQEK